MELIILCLTIICLFSFFKIYRLSKSFDEICMNLGTYQSKNDKNILRLEDKLLLQIKNIRINNNEIDLTKIRDDISKMMKIYEDIDNNGYINTIDDLNEFMEDINYFDVKDRIGNLECILEKWQDVDDIETNITDLNDRIDDLTHNVSRFLVEDDVIELIHNEIPINEDTVKRLNQFDRFIEALKATALEEETNE